MLFFTFYTQGSLTKGHNSERCAILVVAFCYCYVISAFSVFLQLLYTMMRSITAVNNTYTNTKHRRTLLFKMWMCLLTSGFGPWWHEERETQFLKVFANHTMVIPSQRTVHLVMSKISVGRDPKSSTTPFNGQNPTLSFQNPQILWTISSGHDVIHTPVPFPVWRFIMTNGHCHILCAWNSTNWLCTQMVQMPYQTEWIQLTKND